MSWVEDDPHLPNNYGIAWKRLDSLVKRLYSYGYHNQYDQVFKYWLGECLIEEISDSELVKEWQLFTSSSCGKRKQCNVQRPVFDSSDREKKYPNILIFLVVGIELKKLEFWRIKILGLMFLKITTLQISLHVTAHHIKLLIRNGGRDLSGWDNLQKAGQSKTMSFANAAFKISIV